MTSSMMTSPPRSASEVLERVAGEGGSEAVGLVVAAERHAQKNAAKIIEVMRVDTDIQIKTGDFCRRESLRKRLAAISGAT